MTDPTITLEEIERWRTAFAEMLADGRDDAPGDFARLLAAAEVALSHPAALERARAEERERCARWHDAQVAEHVLHGGMVEIEMHRTSAAAIRALGPWVPTHQHEDGHTLRLVMRLTSGDVVCDHRSGDSFVIEPEGFEQWYRLLTPDEARTATEGRS